MFGVCDSVGLHTVIVPEGNFCIIISLTFYFIFKYSLLLDIVVYSQLKWDNGKHIISLENDFIE